MSHILKFHENEDGYSIFKPTSFIPKRVFVLPFVGMRIRKFKHVPDLLVVILRWRL